MAGKRPLDGGHGDPVSGPSKRANLEPDNEGERPGFGSTSASFIKASTKFINFKKSGGEDGYLPKDDSDSKAADIDLTKHFSFREIEAKQKFLRKFVHAMRSKLNSGGSSKGDTDILSQSAQVCKVNPSFLQTELSQIAKEDYPTILKNRSLPSVGYICELRIQDIFFGIGFSVSKAGARDRSSENVMNILNSSQVCVVPMQRRWKGQNYPELVLSSSINPRKDLPVFFQPPNGSEENRLGKTRDHSMKTESKSTQQQQDSRKNAFPELGFQNVAHMGPAFSGKPLEKFVILLNDESPVCVMNNSAQFCKMAVDYFYEKPQHTHNDFIVTIFIEGVAVADAKGPKKILKHKVSEAALQCLNKFCHTVVTNKEIIQHYDTVSRREIKGSQQSSNSSGPTSTARSANPSSGSIGGVGAKMMQMMGWSEGGEIGDRFKVKRDIIKIDNESMHREGLGSQAINSDNINREEAEEIVRQYARSDRVDDLVFSSELNFDERKEVRYMAKRFNLSEKMVAVPMGKRKRVYLVLSKKLESGLIIEQLEREGQFGKYELINPAGGDRSTIKRYLNWQHLRPSQEYPKELRDAKYGERPNDKVTAWKDKSRIKPLMEAWDFKQSTTFDANGSIKSIDQSVMHRVGSMMEGLNRRTGPGKRSRWDEGSGSSPNFGPRGFGGNAEWNQGYNASQTGQWGYNEGSMDQEFYNQGNNMGWQGNPNEWNNYGGGQGNPHAWNGGGQGNPNEWNGDWDNNGMPWNQDGGNGSMQQWPEHHNSWNNSGNVGWTNRRGQRDGY